MGTSKEQMMKMAAEKAAETALGMAKDYMAPTADGDKPKPEAKSELKPDEGSQKKAEPPKTEKTGNTTIDTGMAIADSYGKNVVEPLTESIEAGVKKVVGMAKEGAYMAADAYMCVPPGTTSAAMGQLSNSDSGSKSSIPSFSDLGKVYESVQTAAATAAKLAENADLSSLNSLTKK